jgi:hypothetical protein
MGDISTLDKAQPRQLTLRSICYCALIIWPNLDFKSPGGMRDSEVNPGLFTDMQWAIFGQQNRLQQ